jgi:hypothetical protein
MSISEGGGCRTHHKGGEGAGHLHYNTRDEAIKIQTHMRRAGRLGEGGGCWRGGVLEGVGVQQKME